MIIGGLIQAPSYLTEELLQTRALICCEGLGTATGSDGTAARNARGGCGSEDGVKMGTNSSIFLTSKKLIATTALTIILIFNVAS